MSDSRTPSDDNATESASAESGRTAREVEVPLRLYKTIIVFSTMFSVVLVVGGFVVLDVATQRARLPVSDIDPVLALAGLAMIAGGAALYAFATRFRARGMGKSKEAGDETSDNG
jgi:hypothetical protein